MVSMLAACCAVSPPVEMSARPALEDAAQHRIDDTAHLLGAGGLGDAGDRVVGACETDARGILTAGLVGGALHPLAEDVEAPQRTGERAGGTLRPQLGQRRQADIVDERDELLGDRRVGSGATGEDERLRRLVGDVDLLRGVVRGPVGLEGRRAEEGGPPVVAMLALAHPSRLVPGTDGPLSQSTAPSVRAPARTGADVPHPTVVCGRPSRR